MPCASVLRLQMNAGTGTRTVFAIVCGEHAGDCNSEKWLDGSHRATYNAEVQF